MAKLGLEGNFLTFGLLAIPIKLYTAAAQPANQSSSTPQRVPHPPQAAALLPALQSSGRAR